MSFKGWGRSAGGPQEQKAQLAAAGAILVAALVALGELRQGKALAARLRSEMALVAAGGHGWWTDGEQMVGELIYGKNWWLMDVDGWLIDGFYMLRPVHHWWLVVTNQVVIGWGSLIPWLMVG